MCQGVYMSLSAYLYMCLYKVCVHVFGVNIHLQKPIPHGNYQNSNSSTVLYHL